MKKLYKNKVNILWALSLVFFDMVYAQTSFGVVFDEASYAKLPMIPFTTGIRGDAFPKMVSLRPFCPIPGYQGSISACTGFATGYGAMTIHAALRKHLKTPEAVQQSAFSASYIYNSIKKKHGDCSEGISVESALRFLRDTGDCLYGQFDTARACVAQPNLTLSRLAKANRVRDFASVLPLNSAAPLIINTLKSRLRDSLPVIAVVDVYESFAHPPKGNRIWKGRPNEPLLGLHCLVVVGYNDETRLFEVMSSWGTDWADRGFFQVDYGDMGSICKAAYVLFTAANKDVAVTTPLRPNFPGIPTLGSFALHGHLEFVQVEDRDTGYAFLSQPVRYDAGSGFYFLQAGHLPLGTSYQLTTYGTEGGQYIYLFACDASGKVSLHYPKPFFSAISPSTKALITMPSLGSALKTTRLGDDFVVVVYSDREIPDLVSRLEGLADYRRQNFMERLREKIPELLSSKKPGTELQYDKNTMNLSARSDGVQGSAAAIVLCLEVTD